MHTYIAILRGINVSGQKIIKMDALRKMLEYMGFANITTYVQSGNIVFSSQKSNTDELTKEISNHIKTHFGHDVPVFVLTVDALENVIQNNPLANDPSKDVAFLHVTFLDSIPLAVEIAAINAKKQNGEEIAIFNKTIYLFCPKGYGTTKLTNNFLESKLKVGATTRNWKTTNELLRIAKLKIT